MSDFMAWAIIGTLWVYSIIYALYIIDCKLGEILQCLRQHS